MVSEALILSLLWLPELAPEVSVWWMNRIQGILYLINAMFWLLVTWVFFKKTPYSRPVNKILFLFFMAFLFLAALYVLIPYPLAAKYAAYLIIIFAGTMVALSVFSRMKHLMATQYFSLGMILLGLCWCALYLNVLGYLSLNFEHFNMVRALQFIVVLLFFSFALLDDYKLAEKKMMAHLHEAEQLKDDFLANTSHELRTPLHGIIGLSEDLLSKNEFQTKTDLRDTISLIITSGKRLTRLIDDILDFSRMKRNDLQMSIKPIDFKSICSLVITLCQPMIGQKDIKIKTNFPEPLHLVMADEDRLQQIMLNLLGNAIKFTNTGEIEITAEEKKHYLSISIADTGIGIPEEKLATIFEDFTQVDGSMNREYGGTGLGLAITKRLIELQGGEISAQSKEDAGSTFTFTLPLADKDLLTKTVLNGATTPPEVLKAEDDKYELSGMVKSKPVKQLNPDQAKRILIVDDDPIGLYTLENHLNSVGYDVTAVQDGFTAWFKVQNESWDLVVLDIMMPGMSGFDLCKNIRMLHNMTELPVIMLTARIQMEDMVRGFDSGANDYVTKPVNREELLSRIQTCLQLKQYTDLLRENKVLKDEIIKRKRTEKSLTQVNQRLIALLDVWETGIIVIDHHRIIQFFNQKAVELFGHPQHEVITKSVDSVLQLPELPSTQFKSSHSMIPVIRTDKTTVPIEAIVTPIDVKGDMVYAILCRDAATPSKKEAQMDVARELTLTHQKIQVLQSAFDSALDFLDREGKHMTSELQQIETSMEYEFSKLSKKEIDHIYRRTIVDVMKTVLDIWFQSTGKDKIQFAEESKIWRAHLDVGTYKTRTLDKYLDIEKLPKNPRWKDVVKSVEFVMQTCSEPISLKTALQASISKLHVLIKLR